MLEVSASIQSEQYLGGVEKNIATVNDIFILAGNAELSQAEKRYLPVTKPSPRAIVLAASRGNELGGLTEHHPKCMIDIRGQPLLRRMVSTLNEEKIREKIYQSLKNDHALAELTEDHKKPDQSEQSTYHFYGMDICH